MTISMKYLNLGKIGGRGGTQRFFMLANGIPFEEELLSMTDEWTDEKKRMVESGENPCGAVPVTTITSEDTSIVHLSQHIATCRYLATLHDKIPAGPYESYLQDLVADEYQGWRDTWVKMVFEATAEEKEAYMTEGVLKELTKHDALYAKFKTASPFLSTSKDGQPLWGDAAVFSLIYDHIQTGLLNEDIVLSGDYPNLADLYKTFSQLPKVAEWISSKSE